MKNKKILLFSTLLSLSLIGGNTALAATYTDNLKASSTGTITFDEDGENDKGVPDPGNPDKPVSPTKPDGTTPDPLNPSTESLRIMYVPDFNFGKHEQTSDEIKDQFATATKVRDIETGGTLGTARDVVPFVTTLDLRGSTRGGWDLAVTSTTFKDSAGKDLTGAYIALSNVNYAGSATTKPTVSASGASTKLDPGTKVTLATASATTGIGKYSLAFGNAVNDVTDLNTDVRKATNGVSFYKPGNLGVEKDTYTATLNWELTAK